MTGPLRMTVEGKKSAVSSTSDVPAPCRDGERLHGTPPCSGQRGHAEQATSPSEGERGRE